MNTHRIHRVAKLTGLSKDVIRVWERRYGIVKPSRSANRYRTYTDEDVALLRHLKREMNQGETIGNLAALGREHLLKAATGAARLVASTLPPYERVLHELVELLDPVDKVSFERRLNGAVAVVPFEEALHGILLPLQQRIGDLWHEGKLSVAVEHYVTNHVRQKLFTAMNQLPLHEQGPRIILACPPGEYHEVGLLAAAYVCASRGCRTYYLGANVPFDELTMLCRHIDPHLVLISIISSPQQQEGSRWMKILCNLGTPNRTIVLGGSGAYQVVLPDDAPNIEIMNDLAELERRLTVLFTSQAPRVG
jgi:DNA-binding transcriptional MerR regulator/methylmalonyl-CoA mutase cobalamin-binding subunit